MLSLTALEEGEYLCYLQRRDEGAEQTPGPQLDGALLKTSARSKHQLVRTEVMQVFFYDAGAAVALWFLETRGELALVPIEVQQVLG